MTPAPDTTFAARGGVPLLHGRLRRPAGDVIGVVALCHPHPAFGGCMDVWLLPTLARRLAQDGWLVLRFDFRGVRRSGGTRGDGTAEVADVLGALDHLVDAAEVDAAATRTRRAAVGWSFGAMVALRAAVADGLDDWVGVCPPTRTLPHVEMAAPVPEGLADATVRRTAVVAEHDGFYPPATVDVLAPHRVEIVRGADHFLFDRDDEVAEVVVAALRRPTP